MNDDAPVTGGLDPGGHERTSRDLAALIDLVDRVRQDPAHLALELDLPTALEDLRVADEEMRLQRDHLEELRLRRASATQRRRISSLLPVPLVSLDATGTITEANAAAGALLNVPSVRLVGKPLVGFVHEPDQHLVRTALLRVSAEPTRIPVQLSPRRSSLGAADLVLTADPLADPAARIECTLLPGTAGAGPDHAVLPLRLATAVSEVSRLPVGDPDERRLLARVARTTAAALGDDVWVSVNLGHPSAPTRLASDSEEAAVADGLQIRTGEGPCIDAFDQQETVLVHDLAGDDRWPRLRAVWLQSPVASVVGVPLVAAGQRVGSLNCYGAVPGAFGEPEAQAAEVLALACGAALEAAEEVTRLRELAVQLDQATASRAVIDQAKGIVMARRGCTADEAFAHLAALSQQRNVKVRDLARALVLQTGTAAPVSRRRS